MQISSGAAVFAAAVIVSGAAAGPARAQPAIEVSPSDSRASAPASPENFTGAAYSTPLFDVTDYSDMSGGTVKFDPGARTAWHIHPAGQTLIITDGAGWVQSWGGPKQLMASGDVVRIPPGVKHWHGATATDAMTHVAVAEAVDGSRVTWLEQVDELQYQN